MTSKADPPTPLRTVARMLTPDELAKLRRVSAEQSEYGRRAFRRMAEEKAKAKLPPKKE